MKSSAGSPESGPKAPPMKTQTTLFNESERTDYLVMLAHMVGADGEVTSEEIYALRGVRATRGGPAEDREAAGEAKMDGRD